MTQRRRLLLHALASGAMLSTTRQTMAQSLANPTRLIVAYPPGGQSDLVGRLLAQKLGSLLGVSMVVENRPGAGGAVGVEYAARAAPDGGTLLIGSGSNLTIAPAQESGLRYDPIRDFAAIGRVARVPLVLAVRASLPVTDVAQLLDYARKNPGKLTYASGASLVHFAIESLKASARVDILAVPYKGTAPGLMDVVAGRVDLILADVAAVVPHVESGALRVLAHAGTTRARAFADVSTLGEQGLDFAIESWQGLLAPAGLPDQLIERLQDALRQALASRDFRDGLVRLGFEPIDEPPAAFAAFLRSELERYRRLARVP